MRSAYVLVLLLGTTVGGATAQAPRFDEAGVRALYEQESPVVTGLLSMSDHSAYPAFAGAVPVAALGVVLVRGTDDLTDVYRLGVAEVVAFGSVWGLKQLAGRPRPYAQMAGITSRARGLDRRLLEHDPNAFPSGHAALAFALATSWSLSHDAWYVVAPSMLWATGVAASRVWLGVHYPSDVVVGAALGAGAAVLVHVLGDAITPDGLEPSGGAPVVLRFTW